MANAIDQTAQLFHSEINGGRPSASPAGARDEEDRPSVAEEVFGNSDAHETDVKAGGDGLPIKVRSGKKPSETEIIDDDHDADEGVDEDEDEDGGADEDEDEDEGVDEDEDEDDAGDDDPVMSKKFTVMVDGAEQEVSVKEALKGYIREGTFHKRMNSVSELATAVSTEAEALIEDRKKLSKRFDDLEAEFKAIIPQEPNWDELYAKDPAKARQQEQQFKAIKDRLDEVRKASKAALEEAQKLETERLVKFAEAEWLKFARAARFRNEKHAKKELTAMRNTAIAVGYSDAEVAQAIDSRMLTILHKASKYDRIMAAKPRPVEAGRTQTNTNGAGRKPSRTAPTGGRVQAQTNRSGMTPLERAASVFEQHITPRGSRRGKGH